MAESCDRSKICYLMPPKRRLQKKVKNKTKLILKTILFTGRFPQFGSITVMTFMCDSIINKSNDASVEMLVPCPNSAASF